MGDSVTKRVRLTGDEAARLAKLARRLGTSENDVLRRGIALVERRAALDGLIEMAKIKGPGKERYRFR